MNDFELVARVHLHFKREHVFVGYGSVLYEFYLIGCACRSLVPALVVKVGVGSGALSGAVVYVRIFRISTADGVFILVLVFVVASRK